MINNIDILKHKIFENIKVREDKVICKTTGGNITIPSKQFPLDNKRTIKIFSILNTIPKEEKDLLSKFIDEDTFKRLTNTFNSYEYKIGRCYSNVENIINLFDEDIKSKIKSYVGWVFVGGSLPIHHCWLVYDEKFILDSLYDYRNFDIVERLNNKTIEEQRKILVNFTIETEKMLNSNKFIFGGVSSLYIYVGTESTSELGRNTFNKLTLNYPNHISYSMSGMNSQGLSKFQSLYYNEKK